MPMIHDVIFELREADVQLARLIDAIRLDLYLLHRKVIHGEDPAETAVNVSRETLLERADSFGTQSLFSEDEYTQAQEEADLGKGKQRGRGAHGRSRRHADRPISTE